MIRCSACEDEDPPYFRCLICVDYRLCQLCYTSSEVSGTHRADHPLQFLLRSNEVRLHFKGEFGENCHNSFPCPFCGRLGLTGAQILDHATREMTARCRSFYCPLCLANRCETRIYGEFTSHLINHHNLEPSSRRSTPSLLRTNQLPPDTVLHNFFTSIISRPPAQPAISWPIEAEDSPKRFLLESIKKPPASRPVRVEARGLFVEQLILSMLKDDDVRPLESSSDGSRLRDILAEQIYQKRTRDEGYQGGGEGET